jgi:Flp pilus assembly protein TadD
MRGMPIGSYEIVVRVEGFLESRLRVDVLPANQGTTIVNIPVERLAVETVVDPGEPIIDVAELNRNYPRRALQELERARDDFRKGDNERALERLDEVLKLAPEFYSAHSLQGNVYQKLNRFTDAQSAYTTARQLNPRSAQPLINLGSLYIQEADAPETRTRRLRGRILDDALDALEEAIQIDSHSAVAYYLLGVANYKSSFFEEAEAALTRSFQLEPRIGSTRLMLVNLYMRWEKWEKAVEHIDGYLAAYPKAANRAEIEQTRNRVIEILSTK